MKGRRVCFSSSLASLNAPNAIAEPYAVIREDADSRKISKPRIIRIHSQYDSEFLTSCCSSS